MSLKGSGMFNRGVDSVISEKGLAAIRGVVREDTILLRIHYLRRSLGELSYTEHHSIDQTALSIHEYLKSEGVYVNFENVFEFVKEQFKLQYSGLTTFSPSYEGNKDLDKVDEMMQAFYSATSKVLSDAGFVRPSREESEYEERSNDGDILFTKEIVIPKSSMITYLEKDSRLPFSTMQKLHEKVLESCSSPDTFSVKKENIRELFFYWVLFKDVNPIPAEDGQPNTYRFKIDGEPLADTDDYFEGMKQVISMFENPTLDI